MRQKRRCKYVGGPKMRPEDPDNGDRMAAGVLEGMKLAGYDYPIRKLRRSSGVTCVTLPLQVRNFLTIERGDWLVFGECSWRGLAAFFKLTAERYQALTTGDRKELRLTARKVQGGKGGLFVNIPQAICEILSAELGDSLYFGIRSLQRVVDICVIKGGGDSTGSRRTG